jgi:outer membrane lipoprotein SlyB
MQTKKTALAILVLLVLLSSLGLSGCANQTKNETGAMLAQDYRKMDNDELTLYYYRLTEEIDRTERSGSGSALSIGIGGGSWGHGGGGGVGVSTTTPVGGGGGADDLRNRRAEVRAEMQKRGMKIP